MLIHRHGLTLSLLAIFALLSSARAWSADEELTVTLPPTSDLPKLTDLVSQFTGVSIQYNTQKLTGSVRLAVRGKVNKSELWDLFNQVLISQNFTTIVSGKPAIYQVVPIADAPAQSSILTPEDQKALPYPPGYAVIVVPLAHVSAEAAVKTLTSLFAGQLSQIRAFGADQRAIVISAPQSRIVEAQHVLETLDRIGGEPEVRMFKPQRATPQSIQSSATSAWVALTRIGTQPHPMELQIAPDGMQVLMIASGNDIDQVEKLLTQLDSIEPVVTKTYRPHTFGIDEVAGLLTQILKGSHGETFGVEIIRDKLTGSLIIKASAAQHERIQEVMKNIDDAPPAVRRQVRSFPVKNRQVDEMARILSQLIQAGATQAEAPTKTTTATTPSPTPTNPPERADQNGQPPTVLGSDVKPPAVPQSSGVTVTAGASGDSQVVLTADSVTNRLIALGEPRALDQVEMLLQQLDRRQPQVELDVTLVTLSSSESESLGVELAGQINRNEVSTTVTSLFGLTTANAGDPLARQFAAGGPIGLGGIVLKPGDFAGVIHALDTVTSGKSLIRSKVVVNNNAKATVNGVVQQPLTSLNTGTTVSSTSVTGTSDAGTQLMITPQISVADYVTLTYAITQSSFLGDATVSGGSVIPPAKRSDSVSSVATIPDGYIIALGGLSNRTKTTNDQHLPLLGSIPLLGTLFSNKTKSEADSRFYVFIRANVLRNSSFEDLKRLSDESAQHADVHDDLWPHLEPQLVK